MTIHLTPEQERRIRAVLDRGSYKSVEEVVEAALTAVEQRTVPGFAGTAEELDTLLAERLASKQLTGDEFLLPAHCRSSRDRPSFPESCKAHRSIPERKSLLLGRDMLLAIRGFKIFAHGPSLDLKRFGFITFWKQMSYTLFPSFTADETSSESFKPNEYEFEIVWNAADTA